MKTLILTVGLPRAGKPTWSKQQGYPIVNPDSIRLALHGRAAFPHAEPMVWAIARIMVRSLFLAGHDTVILDATSISNHRRKEWADEDWSVETVCIGKELSVEELERRALADSREDLIPVIRSMSKRIQWPE